MDKKKYLAPESRKVLIITESVLFSGSPTGETYEDSGNYGGFMAPSSDMFDGILTE